MTIVDWQHLDARALALVFARERARWLVELGWETRESWLHVERARRAWGLAGLAAIDDDGRVRGVTFIHQTQQRYDIGGIFADSTAVRQALLAAAVTVSVEAGATDVGAFVYDPAQTLAASFRELGFGVEVVDYLAWPLDVAPAPAASPGADLTVRGWRNEDIAALAALLDVSYEPEAARRFITEPGLSGWTAYVTNLVQHAACGIVEPALTRLAFEGDVLVGAALLTNLGPATAHVAQVVVHPGWRGQGLASFLLTSAAAAVHDADYARLTLMAGAGNGTAQRLYRQLGFTSMSGFLAATRGIAAATPAALAS